MISEFVCSILGDFNYGLRGSGAVWGEAYGRVSCGRVQGLETGGGRRGAVFGERMRAGAVLVGAGEVWRDMEDRLFLEEAAGCCWTVGGAWWRSRALRP